MLKRARYEEESFLFCLSFLLLCEYIFSLLSVKLHLLGRKKSFKKTKTFTFLGFQSLLSLSFVPFFIRLFVSTRQSSVLSSYNF